MEKFEFNSAICTSVEESKRLLKLGLKKETADCYYQFLNNKWELRFGQPITYGDLLGSYLFPAWSLHRLLSLMEYSYITDLDANNPFEDCITRIEIMIKEFKCFNKDYLEDKK